MMEQFVWRTQNNIRWKHAILFSCDLNCLCFALFIVILLWSKPEVICMPKIGPNIVTCVTTIMDSLRDFFIVHIGWSNKSEVILDSFKDLPRQQIFTQKAKKAPIGPILNMPLLYQPAHLFSGNVLSVISV